MEQTCNLSSCSSTGSKRCTRCWQVGYCSRDCQEKDWKVHKKDCKKVKEVDKVVTGLNDLTIDGAKGGQPTEAVEEGDNGLGARCFKVQEVTGKGLGMVAARTLLPGEVIITEQPILID